MVYFWNVFFPKENQLGSNRFPKESGNCLFNVPKTHILPMKIDVEYPWREWLEKTSFGSPLGMPPEVPTSVNGSRLRSTQALAQLLGPSMRTAARSRRATDMQFRTSTGEKLGMNGVLAALCKPMLCVDEVTSKCGAALVLDKVGYLLAPQSSILENFLESGYHGTCKELLEGTLLSWPGSATCTTSA